MATQPMQQPIDLSQLDLSDPETRSFVEGQLDLSDPQTKTAWEQFAGPVAATQEAPRRGGWERFKDSFTEAGQHNFPGWVARKWYDWTDYGIDQLKQAKPGQPDEWYEQKADELIGAAQKGLREELAARQEADPSWRPDESFWENVGAIDRWGPYLAGQVLGSAGPESALAPGATAGARMAAQGAIGGAADVVYQGADMLDHARDEYSLEQTLGEAAASAGFQGAFEVPGFVRNLFKKHGGDTTPAPDPRAPLNDNGQLPMKLSGEQEGEYQRLLNVGTPEQILSFFQDKPEFSVDPQHVQAYVEARNQGAPVRDDVTYTPSLEERLAQEAQSFQQGREQAPMTALEEEAATFRDRNPEPTPEDLWPSDETLKQREQAMEQNLQAEVKAWRNRGQTTPEAEAPVEPEAPTFAVEPQRIEEIRTEVTKNWKNAPDFEVVGAPEDIADPVIRQQVLDEAPDAKGFVGPDGRVRLIAKNIESEEEVPAIVFHEALGHNGMTQVFRDRLDKMLTNFYNDSPDFRDRVDDWMARNPTMYSDRPDSVARAADEVLAEMSEAGALTPKMIDRFKNFVKQVARRIGMKTEFSMREIETILGMAHRAVVDGRESAVANGFRYSRPASSNRYAQPGQRQKKSLSPESMRTENDVEDLLDFLQKNTVSDTVPVPDAELELAASNIGLTSSKYVKGKSLKEQDVAARVRAAHNLITSQVDDLQRLAEKLQAEGRSPSLEAQIRQKLAVVQAVYAKFDEDTSELGRALRILREASESRRSAQAALRFSQEAGGLDSVFTDPDSLVRFLKNFEIVNKTEGPAAAGKYIREVSKVKPEDYASSVVFNFMLSSPTTWKLNFISTGLNFATELANKGLAGTLGQGKKIVNPELDRVYGREVLARLYGPLSAFWQFRTWKNVFEAFKTGQDKVGTRGKVSTDRMVMKGPATIIETPQRVMAMSDEFWRNFIQASNLYGEAARDAAKKGLKGKEFWKEVNFRVADPTEEMLEKATSDTQRMLFRDPPSRFAKWITDVQTPRYQDEIEYRMVKGEDGKQKLVRMTTNEKDTALRRTGRFALRTMIPFIPTIDSIARTAIRNAGPLAVISKDIRNDLRAGGAARDAALARMTMSSALMGYFATLAAQGQITGVQDPDYRKQAALGAVAPPMSIKIGDEWVSYRGYDPLSMILAAAATSVERGGDEEGITPEKAQGLIIGLASALKENTYAESVLNFMELVAGGAEAASGGKAPDYLLANFVGGHASNLLSPAFVRWVNQEFLDPYSRDTTGDDSILGRVEGRAISGVPVVSESLPQKYDVFGREVLNPRQPRKVEDNPAILELNRLEKLSDSVLVGPVGPVVNDRRLTSEEFQQYQKESGEFLVKAMSKIIDKPKWERLPDEAKIEIVKMLKTDIQSAVRDHLFPEEEVTE